MTQKYVTQENNLVLLQKNPLPKSSEIEKNLQKYWSEKKYGTDPEKNDSEIG